MLSIKEIVLVVHVTLVKPNVTRKLDRKNIRTQLKVWNHQNTFEVTSTTILHGLLNRKNIRTQLKVWNHQNTFEVTSTTILHGLSFQMPQKMLRPGRT